MESNMGFWERMVIVFSDGNGKGLVSIMAGFGCDTAMGWIFASPQSS